MQTPSQGQAPPPGAQQQPLPAGYAPLPQKKGMSGCAIAGIVTGIVVLVLGVPMLIMAIYGFRRYIANAKEAEARQTLGQLASDAAAAYDREAMAAPVIGQPGALVHSICASASISVPASAASIQGKKYQSTHADWTADGASNAGFACLKFTMDQPQYYMYSYKRTGSTTGSAAGDGFTATANGDLNADGVLSTFSISGQVDSSGSTLNVAPHLTEKDPNE